MAASYGFLFVFGIALIDRLVNGDRGTNWLGFALVGLPLLAVTVLSTILWRRVRRRPA